MLEGFKNNPEEASPEESSPQPQKKNYSLLIILIILIFLMISIIAILIYIIIHFNNSTIYIQKETNKEKEKRAPIIGITGMRVTEGKPETIFSVDQTQIHYIEAVEMSGGVPLSLPVLQTFNTELIKRQVEAVDGIIIQGGLDVDPSLYNEARSPLLGNTDLQTDNFLMEIIKQASIRKIPILGICRGLQILNVYYGGSLYQDLSEAGLESTSHRQDNDTLCNYHHTINVVPDSRLSKMFPNNSTLYVNSFHHQAIKKVANNFVVDARSNENIVEVFHLDSEEQWIFGVQFHPEQFLQCGNNAFMPIFSELINKAKESQ